MYHADSQRLRFFDYTGCRQGQLHTVIEGAGRLGQFGGGADITLFEYHVHPFLQRPPNKVRPLIQPVFFLQLPRQVLLGQILKVFVRECVQFVF